MIHTHRAPSGDLTTHTVEGSVTTEMFLKTIESFYTGAPTLKVLWDFRAADAADISSNDIQRLVDEVWRYVQVRQGGKTALVFSRDLGYGQGRIFQARTELQGMPVAFYCFRSLTEAQAWLDAD